ncbi:hypothetical protein KIPB_008212 [Kipferlia bialata]|uniref:Kelch-type beta propeller n=1 Tax=Kipferlia bialata TaxID=797122 RepID=A0A391NMZ8_9EUKA|nr:hypothetical protein KIPB_008212 [Kipferlia bialata]|eukprot:g8212.t1
MGCNRAMLTHRAVGGQKWYVISLQEDHTIKSKEVDGPRFPRKVDGVQLVRLPNHIVAYGADNSSAINERFVPLWAMAVYPLETETWETIEQTFPGPTPCFYPHVFSLDEYLVVAGGSGSATASGLYKSGVWKWGINERQWIPMAMAPTGLTSVWPGATFLDCYNSVNDDDYWTFRFHGGWTKETCPSLSVQDDDGRYHQLVVSCCQIGRHIILLHSLGPQMDREASVGMLDPVSLDLIQCQPLTLNSGRQYSHGPATALLNPTTLLVVGREDTLVVDLDPSVLGPE